MLENVNPKYILEASLWGSFTFIAVLILRYYFPNEGEKEYQPNMEE